MGVRDLGVCQECGKPATRVSTIWAEEERAFSRVEHCKRCWREHKETVVPRLPVKTPRLFRLLREHNEDPELDVIMYQLGPINTRVHRVTEAWNDYYGEHDEGSLLFFEVECLEEQLLLAHRCIQWKPIEKAWWWCQQMLAYLSKKHGYKLQIPHHLPLL